MPESFDTLEFARFVRSQWRLFATACGIAVVLAAAVSFLLPRRYTATATLLIEPPAGNDPRAATVLSPIYLESLRTYERIASNDTLFLRALQHLGLRGASSGASVESLKRRILKVSKPTSTKILEVNATLDDPRKAQALAQFIAEQTVELGKSVDAGSEEEITKESRSILAAAGKRLETAEQERALQIRNEPVQSVEDKVASAIKLQTTIQSDLAKARAEWAYYSVQAQAPPAKGGASSDADWIRTQVAALQARIKLLETQEEQITHQLATDTALLENRRARREVIDSQVKTARAEYDSANTKLNDILVSSVFRSERLHIIDPGIVPERPSFPNTPLNVIAALLASFVATMAYVAVRFSQARMTSVRAAGAYSFR
jgi:capsular polysaccharide biosynthesis protein